mgnify:CR=1 FL=1
MPEVGEIKKGFEIGKTGHQYGRYYIFSACEDCGKGRWIRLLNGRAESARCVSCVLKKSPIRRKGEYSPNWKGGRYIDGRGYVRLYLPLGDFFYSMTNKKGYVFEHRLVIAKALGRCLHRWEIVHHKGNKYPLGNIENKQDNRYPENLDLTMGLPHKGKHQMLLRIQQLEKRVTLLEAENILLRGRIKSQEGIYDKG